MNGLFGETVGTGIYSDGCIVDIDDLVPNPPDVEGSGDGPGKCGAVLVVGASADEP